MSKDPEPDKPAKPAAPKPPVHRPEAAEIAKPKEIGGTQGPEPTRYGDWQHKGRVSDF